ncbi:MAG: hypothetical protein JW723_03240 [Bacteroidales bacterium]|nr:hypothetical protein [Bacteroidales bacterium]
MKNISKTLGVISLIVLFIGTIFKKSHWPGAGIILTISALAVLAFFITYLFIGIKPLSTKLEKICCISGSIAMCITLVSFLFKVQHWPGAGILIIISLAALLITGVLLIIDAIRETDQAKRSIKTLFAFSLTTIVIMLFMITVIF